MQMEHVTRDAITLIGISVRTSKQEEFNPEAAKIPECVMKFFQEQISERIPNRILEGKTFCAYTDYEGDHDAPYTFFIGEQVKENSEVPEGLKTMTIPAQTYAKYTTDAGPMPDVVIGAWQQIWATTDEQFGGPREYKADFELYDPAKSDAEQKNVVVDLFIGIKSAASANT